MKFTLAWLKDHLLSSAGVDEIADRLTMLGLEVEEVIDRSGALAPFVVGRVVQVTPHPDADNLTVCVVDRGTDKVQVVCGAPNAHSGMKGVFAAAGTTLPSSGAELKSVKIRGVASNGMLCSEREMGLGEDHSRIIELPADAPTGQPFAKVMGLDDPVIDIAVLPNRQDCLGVRGIARDLAAAGLGQLKALEIEPVPGTGPSPIGVDLVFEGAAANACPMFVGRLVGGVSNRPGPAWMQNRLRAIGLKPISALVDMTNYVTYDLGRPLHVFDADNVAGNIHVRLSRSGESLSALDGKNYTLDDQMTVIADEDGVLGLGGVIGGESSGCTAETENVFIESALFDPLRTAATGRKLAIESDARYRFERGVDPAFALAGIEMATRMALDSCGGEPSEPVVAGKEPDWRRAVEFRPARVHALGGLEVAEPETVRILRALGFDVDEGEGTLRVAVPSWRGDIGGEADLVEEVTRIHGYDNIPSVPLERGASVTGVAISAGDRRGRIAKRALAAAGMIEAVTWSFLSRRQAELFGGAGPELVLANPISAELEVMRPSLLPNLIAACGRNLDRGFAQVALFEVGPRYGDDTPGGQSTAAAGVRRGPAKPRHWTHAPRPVDAFDAKTDAFALLDACGVAADKVRIERGAPAWYHPGRSGMIMLGPQRVLASFGEIHPAVLAEMDVKGPLAGFEVLLDDIPQPRAKASRSRPPLDFSDKPAVERDFAFVVDRHVPAQDLVRAAQGAERALIREVGVFDVYAGAGVPEAKKSVAISVRLQPREKTLTEAEIEAIAKKIVAAVGKATGAVLRG